MASSSGQSLFSKKGNPRITYSSGGLQRNRSAVAWRIRHTTMEARCSFSFSSCNCGPQHIIKAFGSKTHAVLRVMYCFICPAPKPVRYCFHLHLYLLTRVRTRPGSWEVLDPVSDVGYIYIIHGAREFNYPRRKR